MISYCISNLNPRTDLKSRFIIFPKDNIIIIIICFCSNANKLPFKSPSNHRDTKIPLKFKQKPIRESLCRSVPAKTIRPSSNYNTSTWNKSEQLVYATSTTNSERYRARGSHVEIQISPSVREPRIISISGAQICFERITGVHARGARLFFVVPATGIVRVDLQWIDVNGAHDTNLHK